MERLANNPDDLFDLLDELGSDFEVDSQSDDEDPNPLDVNAVPNDSDEESIANDDEEENVSTSDSESNLPLSRLQTLRWKNGNFHSKEPPSKKDDLPSDVKTPKEYFKEYLDDDFFSLAATHTAQYYLQTSGKQTHVTPEEIKKFFGMHAVMGCIHFPRIHLYWSDKYKIPLLENALPRDRFYFLRTNFHVVDNLSVSEETKRCNKLWKIQPLIDRVRNHCVGIERKEKEAYSIDEQMIPFLGRCPVRQFVRNKPRPVGLKNFVLTTSDGIVMDFEIYQGATTPLRNRELGLGPAVILRLVETLPENSYLYFDRYFSTVGLMDKLLLLNMNATATIMANRFKGYQFKKDNAMKKGESEEVVRSDGKLCITKWKDNKSVLMLSTAFGKEPESVVRRWDKVQKERVNVSCPIVVKSYNEHMGGVDICDQMLEYYRSFFRTRKWTLKTILHFFDLAIVNSWMEYRRDCKSKKVKAKDTMDLLKFRLNLGEYLLSGTKRRTPDETESDEENNLNQENERRKRRVPATLPCVDKRYDGFEHWPSCEDMKNPVKCRLEGCDSRSRVRCTKCNIFLCFTKHKNCFRSFHCK